MIKNLLEKIKMANLKRKVNKPCYPIYKLITGEVIWLHKRNKDSKNTEYLFRHVKDFAIFKLDSSKDNLHIISGQNLQIMEEANEKDYAIKDWQMFKDQPNMKMYMRKHHLTEDSLLSFAQIMSLEQAMNKNHEYKNDNDKMFC